MIGIYVVGDDRRDGVGDWDLFAYALSGAYLGSRTGQTQLAVDRSIFGVTGSYIVSVLVVVGALGWSGFRAG